MTVNDLFRDETAAGPAGAEFAATRGPDGQASCLFVALVSPYRRGFGRTYGLIRADGVLSDKWPRHPRRRASRGLETVQRRSLPSATYGGAGTDQQFGTRLFLVDDANAPPSVAYPMRKFAHRAVSASYMTISETIMCRIGRKQKTESRVQCSPPLSHDRCRFCFMTRDFCFRFSGRCAYPVFYSAISPFAPRKQTGRFHFPSAMLYLTCLKGSV